MGSRPIYSWEQLSELYGLEIYMVRPGDLRKVKGSWRVYLGLHPDTKKMIKLYRSARKYPKRSDAWVAMKRDIDKWNKGQIPHRMTFKDFTDKWINRTTCRESTRYNYVKTLEKHLTPYFGEMKLVKLTPTAINQYLIEKQAEGKLSPVTINEHLILMRSILRAAYHDNLIDKNPAEAIRRLPQVSAPVEAFTEAEVHSILEKAKTHFPEWYVPILHAFMTGERAGEIWAHKWRDFRKGKIRVEKSVRQGKVTATKDKETRHVDMPDRLQRALSEASAYHSKLKSELVYCNKKGKHVSHRNFLERVWYPLLEKAKVQKRKFHCTRHTFASLHLKHGTSLGWISRQLGHSKLEFTFKTYVHFMPQSDDGAADRLAAVIGG